MRNHLGAYSNTSRALALILCCLMALPMSALAQAPPPDEDAGSDASGPRLAVVMLTVKGAPQNQLHEYANRVEARLSTSGAIQVMGASETKNALQSKNVMAGRRTTSEDFIDAKQRLTRGEDLVYENTVKAANMLQGVVDDLRNLRVTLGQNPEMWETLFKAEMLLARAHRENGKKKKSRRVLQETIETFGVRDTVRPENGYHPDLVKLYQQTAKKTKALRTAELMVVSTPPGGTVRINGIKQDGTTPLAVKNLAAGRYFVQVSNAARTGCVHMVDVELGNEGQRLAVNLETEDALDSSRNRIALRFDNPSHIKTAYKDIATQLGSTLNVDFVLGIGLETKSGKTRLVGHLVNARTGAKVKTVRAKAGLDLVQPAAVEKVSSKLMGVWQETGTVATSGHKPWFKNWLGWSLAGAGLITLTAGIYFGLDYLDNVDKAKQANTRDLQRKYQDAANDVRYHGPVLGVIGTLLIGGGVTVFILHAKNNPAPTAADALTLNLGERLKLQPLLGHQSAGLQLGLDW